MNALMNLVPFLEDGSVLASVIALVASGLLTFRKAAVSRHLSEKLREDQTIAILKNLRDQLHMTSSHNSDQASDENWTQVEKVVRKALTELPAAEQAIADSALGQASLEAKKRYVDSVLGQSIRQQNIHETGGGG